MPTTIAGSRKKLFRYISKTNVYKYTLISATITTRLSITIILKRSDYELYAIPHFEA